MRALIDDWAGYLAEEKVCGPDLETIRRHGRSGRPAGDPAFVATLEQLSGRRLRRQPAASRANGGESASRPAVLQEK